MLSQQQIQEIRDALEQSKNPLIFFDDDTDGLTSFLLLYRKYKKGHGVPVKAPQTEENLYLRKIQAYDPDLVVVLDRPVLVQSLLNKIQVPIIWIDHHEPLERQGVKYYNPMVLTKGDNRPTSYWCYQVAQQDLWIAMVGIISDWYIPEFVKNFEYKELLGKAKTPPEVLFETEFGRLIKVFNFSLKGRMPDIKKQIAALMKIDNPMEILQQSSPKGKFIYRHYEKINQYYEEILLDALHTKGKDNVFVFTYPSTQHSFTGTLSNELLHRREEKVLIIAREKDGEMRISLRGKETVILPIVKKALEKVHGSGGGHEMACGANVRKEKFQIFVEEIRKLLKGQSKTNRASVI
ncbi:MAG TPA: DHH family phosphoesterase [Candidatus Nanoarchaeia archaeon]|nr:DHH family phosphoesterase [Candidatus Nanoarchaeia archaeon]